MGKAAADAATGEGFTPQQICVWLIGIGASLLATKIISNAVSVFGVWCELGRVSVRLLTPACHHTQTLRTLSIMISQASKALKDAEERQQLLEEERQ